jgi:hypothetical protein
LAAPIGVEEEEIEELGGSRQMQGRTEQLHGLVLGLDLKSIHE